MRAEQERDRLLREFLLLQKTTKEQENLLRFKVEVLVNMLTVEEQRNAVVTDRLETMRWLLHSKEDCLNEENVRLALSSIDNTLPTPAHISKIVDLTTALTNMQSEFDDFKEDILHALAVSDGKVESFIPRDIFVRQVYEATERIKRSDVEVSRECVSHDCALHRRAALSSTTHSSTIAFSLYAQIVAFRFENGFNYVSVPEFLEFFMTPTDLRAAKAANAAIRMSFDLLQLPGYEDDEYFEENAKIEIKPGDVTNQFPLSLCRLLLALIRLMSSVCAVWYVAADYTVTYDARAGPELQAYVAPVASRQTSAGDAVCGDERIRHVRTDAHQANGVQRDAAGDLWVGLGAID